MFIAGIKLFAWVDVKIVKAAMSDVFIDNKWGFYALIHWNEDDILNYSV